MIFLCLFIFHYSHSKELARINLKLTGEIVTYSCSVDFENNKIVNLKNWGVRSLKSINNRTEEIPFTINLINCPPHSEIKVLFRGENETLNNELLAIDKNLSDAADGVAIEILDGNKNRLPLGNFSPSVKIDDTGKAKINFYANYISIKEFPTAGIANAKATFMFSYD